jgi:hypothetical protein
MYGDSMSTHELKHLQSRKTSAEKALLGLREELKEQAEDLDSRKQELLQLAKDSDDTYQSIKKRLHELECQISAERQTVKELENDIKGLKSSDRPITISEHAILRYLERVKGVDLEAIKLEILPDILRNQFDKMGDGCYPASTHRLQIRERVVVTVLDTDMVKKRSRKKRDTFKSRPNKRASNARKSRKHQINSDEVSDYDF